MRIPDPDLSGSAHYEVGVGRKSEWTKLTSFVCILGLDVVAFVVTFGLLMLCCCRSRFRRLVRIDGVRFCRKGNKKPRSHLPRRFFLWFLYIQGALPHSTGAFRPVSASTVWSTEDVFDTEDTGLMALTGNGTTSSLNDIHLGGNSLMELQGVVHNEFDDPGFGDQGADDDAVSQDAESQQSLHESTDEEGTEDDSNRSPDGAALPPQPPPNDDPESEPDLGYDWLHVHQFRRGYAMRHCFSRWSQYRYVVRAIADTWNVDQNSVMQFFELRAHPSGIPFSTHAVIVQIVGEYDTRLHVLVDIEVHQPAHFHENQILDRQVYKFPYRISRQGILQLTQTEGICHSRMNRCLVTHNRRLLPLQVDQLYELQAGDYFTIKIPPLEDILLDFPVPQQSLNLLQTHVKRFEAQKGSTTGSLNHTEQALGNAEEATRDLPSVIHTTYFRIPFRDPMEGLPDPGNPDVFCLSDEEDPDYDPRKTIDVQVNVPWNWQEILRLLVPWEGELCIDLPSQVPLTPVALQFLSGCQIGIQDCSDLWIYTDGSFNPHSQSAAFAIGIFGTSSVQHYRHHFGGWFGGRLITDSAHRNFTGAIHPSAAEAEISALAWAHVWAIQSGFSGKITFCFDSMLAGFGASGDWGCNSSWLQLHKLRQLSQLYLQLRGQRDVGYEHVKAHSNQPANEVLDGLAKFCASTDSSGDHLPQTGDWSGLFTADNLVLEWGWWIVASLSAQGDLPQLAGVSASARKMEETFHLLRIPRCRYPVTHHFNYVLPLSMSFRS